MTISNPRLLTPPREKEEIYPYRRVWRSIVLEGGVVIGAAVALFVAVGIFKVTLPASLTRYLTLPLALLPAILWFIFSWWRERQAVQPRQHLLMVAFIAGLAANAIGVPLVNDFFQVDRWLPLASAVDRIVGYTFAVGLTQEFIKYFVVRYTVWPHDFRTRLDGIAYGAAAAVGYTTVLNLHFVLSNQPTLDVVAARVFATYATQIAASLIVGYGLAEVRFSNPSPIFLTLTIALAGVITGIAIPIRAGLINTVLSLDVSSPRSIFGLGFSAVLLIVPCVILAFLFDSADRRADEAAKSRED